MSETSPKYYINSHTHRVKLRLLQVLILSIKYANKVTSKILIMWVVLHLTSPISICILH